MTLLQVNFNEAFRSLWGARQRSLLALVGIVIGIGSVIGMVSIGSIVQQEALRQFKDMGIDIITIRKGSGDSGTKEFIVQDVLKITEEKRSVTSVAPYMTSGTELVMGRQKINMEEMGVTPAFFDINKLAVVKGRSVTELDDDRYFCVVGTELAAFLEKSGDGKVLGRQVTAEGRVFTVIGVLDKVAEGGLRPYGINRAILIPISTASRTFRNPQINTIMARIAPQANITQVKADVRDFFQKKGRGIPVEVISAEELIERMKKQMQMFSLLLGAIGSIALIVGGIGVMNVMLISVTERRSEIGLRRALGAQQSDIQSQFLIESVLLCLAGGIIGIIIGVGVSYLFAYFSKWQFIMSYVSIALGFGVSTAVGVFCGFYPARTAAKLDPIKALRS